MGNEMVRRTGDELSLSSDRDTARVAASLVMHGDVSGLKPEERVRYYLATCEQLGLNPNTQPFAFLRLNGKEVMYATRGATDQLAAIHKLHREITDGPRVMDFAGVKILFAACRTTHPNGRTETATAAVPLPSGAEAICNAVMKTETKARRRATLAILGLGILDESETDTLTSATREEEPRELPATTHAPTLDAGARKVPDLATLDNVTRPVTRPASQPPPAVACQLDAQDIARVVERLKEARSLATVQEIVTQFSATADLASEVQKAEVRHAVKIARAAIESGMRATPPDGIDPEPPTPPRGGRKNARAVPQTTEPAPAPVESATAPVGAPVDLATVVDAPDTRASGGDDLSSRAARVAHLGAKHHLRAVVASYLAHCGLPHYLDDCTQRMTEIVLDDGTSLHAMTARKRLVDARNAALRSAPQTPARRTTGEKRRAA